MIHVNEFIGGEIVAAYTTDDVPPGTPVGRSGNAVLLRDGDKDVVVSRPRIEGDILDVIPAAVGAPVVDLSKSVRRNRNYVRISIRNFV